MEQMCSPSTSHGLEAVSKCGQLAFEEIISEHLFRPIDYEDSVPVRWYPAEEWGMAGVGRAVMVDPLFSFGVPLMADCWIPAETLYLSFVAEEEDIDAVARNYEVSSESVCRAVAFQREKARRQVASEA